MMNAFNSAVRDRDGGKEVVFTARRASATAGGMQLHFDVLFEMTITQALVRNDGKGTIEDLATISSVIGTRRRFLQVYESTPAKQWRHPLLDWHVALSKTPHFEAYHYWLLGPARPKELASWEASHRAELASFEEWIPANRPKPAAFDGKQRVLPMK